MRREALTAVCAVVVAVMLVGVAAWYASREHRAMRDLPAQERRALYERTLETLERICSEAHAQELTSFCREQSELIVQLPECDARCHAVAARHLPRPTR